MVWSQDDWSHSPFTKKPVIKGALLGSASVASDEGILFGNTSSYASLKNSTLDRYNDAKLEGKHAWVFNYTSCSSGSDFEPFDNAKEIHRWLYDHSDYDDPERLVCGDTFTGVMAFDFNDELMASHIYKTNFRRQYVTIHGVSPAGEELVTPLTLYVGESENVSKLLSMTSQNIIKKYFDLTPYAVMTAGQNYFLTKEDEVIDQADMASKATSTYSSLQQGPVPTDLYVHLQTPIKEIDLDIDMPKCGTAVSADVPQISVNTDGSSGYEGTGHIIGSEGAIFAGNVQGGDRVPIKVILNNKWGYYFDNNCTITSSKATIKSTKVSGGLIEIEAEALIPHDAEEKDAQPASCTSDGIMAHYECKSCKKLLLEKKASEDDPPVLVEVTQDDIKNPKAPALGHEWGEWEETTSATETEEGVKTRTCSRCGASETISIPVLNHEHGLVHVVAKESTCTQAGNIEYWVCSNGTNPCGCYYGDSEGKIQYTLGQIMRPLASHNWSYPTYSEEFTNAETCYVISTYKCKNQGCSATKTRTVRAQVTITPPTCTASGLVEVDAMLLEGPYHSLTPMGDPLSHDWGDYEVTKAATCNEKGEKTQTCSCCGETNTEEIDIDPSAHITYIEIDETTNSATCDTEGRAMQYEVCSLCNKVVSSSRVDTPQREHVWGKPVYEWSEDNTEATATRTCRRNGCHEEESETVQVGSRVLEDSSCVTAGRAIYDAQFENEAFDTQEKVVEIAATGHQWNAGEITKPATATESGVRTYTCTVCEEKKTEDIEPTGGGSGGGGIPGVVIVEDPVQKVLRMINDLPETITLKDADKVKAARDAYDKLSDGDKKKVSPVLLKKLTDAEEAINGSAADDQRIADEAARIMAWIPLDETLATTVQIAAARAAYDALTDAQKSKIDPALVMRMLKAEYHLKTTAAETKEIKLTSAAAKKGGKARITWKKQTGINGYQILCSSSKKFTKKTTKKFTAKAGLTSKVLKKLKPGKKYFVKVRAYTTVYDPIANQKVKVYTQYSNIKKIKAK